MTACTCLSPCERCLLMAAIQGVLALDEEGVGPTLMPTQREALQDVLTRTATEDGAVMH